MLNIISEIAWSEKDQFQRAFAKKRAIRQIEKYQFGIVQEIKSTNQPSIHIALYVLAVVYYVYGACVNQSEYNLTFLCTLQFALYSTSL